MHLVEVRGNRKETLQVRGREVQWCEKEPLGPFRKMFGEHISTYLTMSAMSPSMLKGQREGIIPIQHYFLIVYSIGQKLTEFSLAHGSVPQFLICTNKVFGLDAFEGLGQM